MADFQRMYSVSIVTPAPYAGIQEIPLRALRTSEHVDALVRKGYTVRKTLTEIVDLTHVPTLDELANQIETSTMLTKEQRAILRGQLAKLRGKGAGR